MLSNVNLVIVGIACFSFWKTRFFQTHFKEPNFFFFFQAEQDASFFQVNVFICNTLV